jgi:hypothetical protein
MELQLSERHTNMSPQKKMLQATRSQMIAFFSSLGAVYHKFVPVGRTVNSASCIEVLSVWGVPLSRNGQKNKLLDRAPWQCAQVHLPCNMAIFSEEPKSNPTPATVFLRSHSVWLLSLPKPQDWTPRSSFCVHRRNSTESESRSHSHIKRGVP